MPAQLIWVMVVNGGHCTRKIPKGEGRAMRNGGESLEEIAAMRRRETSTCLLCHGIIVVLGAGNHTMQLTIIQPREILRRASLLGGRKCVRHNRPVGLLGEP